MQPGTQLGPYRITSQLGAGGMGEVWAATDTRLDRKVAIKVLPERLAGDPERLARFEREARAISSLNHPHICALHDVGDQDGTHFLVMEYVDGEALDKRLERGPVPLDDALGYAIQMADALDKAHQQGIVHRDIKPANVMITKSGVKLLDFGLAKLGVQAESRRPLSLIATRDSDLTQEGTILGTFRYMAPEQVEGKDVDARTDIYAMCLVLYEMITGRRAIDGDTQASLIAAILKDKPRPLGELQPITPRGVDRVVQTGLEKDPDKRWQSAREIRHALEWIRSEGAPIPATPPARSGLWKGVAAALAVTTALSLLLALLPDRPAEWRLEVNTGETSDPAGFALSPDGRRLAYIASGPDGTQMWLRPLDDDEGAAEPLTGTQGASHPFWSPDGKSIAFFAEGWLNRIDLDSRVMVNLARAPSPYGGTWRGDGTILYSPGPNSKILRVSEAGGDSARVPTSSGGADLYPKFLDDGEDFIFSPLGLSQIHLGRLDSAESKFLLDAPAGGAQYHPAGYMLSVRQGALLARRLDRDAGEMVGEEITVADGVITGSVGSGAGLSVSASGVIAYRRGETRFQLGWFDSSGRQVGAAGGESTGLRWPVVDGDGRVAASEIDSGNLWIIGTETSAPRQLTFSEGFKQGPIWSPDGLWVAFRAAGVLRRKLSSGAGEEQVLLEGPGAPLPTSWSPDGSAVLLSIGSNDIEYLSLDDMATHPYVDDPAHSEVRGVFSPDGRWVAYESDESGRFEVYVRSFPDASGQAKVSSDGGSFARWSRDGQELYYLSTTGVLMAVSVDTTGEVFRYEPARERFQTRIAATTLGDVVHPYDVGSDGRFLMFVPVEEVPDPITVILNWDPEAK